MPLFGWVGLACGPVILLLLVCALCAAAKESDECFATDEELDEFHRTLDMPRCRCGAVLDIGECDRGECDVCRAQLRIPRVRGGQELVPAPVRRRYREIVR
jgi:hypothetical protein